MSGEKNDGTEHKWWEKIRPWMSWHAMQVGCATSCGWLGGNSMKLTERLSSASSLADQYNNTAKALGLTSYPSKSLHCFPASGEALSKDQAEVAWAPYTAMCFAWARNPIWSQWQHARNSLTFLLISCDSVIDVKPFKPRQWSSGSTAIILSRWGDMLVEREIGQRNDLTNKLY